MIVAVRRDGAFIGMRYPEVPCECGHYAEQASAMSMSEVGW